MQTQKSENENGTQNMPKNVKSKRRLLGVIEWIVLIVLCSSVGGLLGFLLDNMVVTLIVIGPICYAIILLFRFLREKKFSHLYEKLEDCSDEEDDSDETKALTSPPTKAQKFLGHLITTLQIGAGGLVGFSAVTIILRLVDGYDYGFGLYFGLSGLAVAILFAGLILSKKSNAVIRKEFSDDYVSFKDSYACAEAESKLLATDERVQVASYKAGYVTFWSALAMILVLGSTITMLAPENVSTVLNIVTAGFLSICFAGIVIYTIVHNYYLGQEDFTPISKPSIRLKLIFFVLSLVPLSVMALVWILSGLSAPAIAFFIAHAIVSGILLADLVDTMAEARKAKY
jgi:hypothetical protein